MRHVIWLALFGLAGCGGTEYRAGGIGKAQFEVTLDDRTVAGNFPMTVEIDRLVPPWEVGREYRHFAVWSVPHGERTPRLEGFLDYDRDARSGRLETVTPHDAFAIFVTAERSGIPSEPSEAIVAGQSVEHQG
jgi:hypothetical protein